ncbi:MAG: sulfotransferase domain-containing protein, partial [Alphaproteobacteria bacterium]
WSDHARSWLASPIQPLLVRFEDMLDTPADSLERVARHLRWNPSASAIAGAVEATRFDALQAQEERHGFRERTRAEVPFFRRGLAGGWRDSLTPAQRQRIEASHGEAMAMFGYL